MHLSVRKQNFISHYIFHRWYRHYSGVKHYMSFEEYYATPNVTWELIWIATALTVLGYK